MTEISSDKKFEALHEHDNDTFTNIKESNKFRDKLMLLVILMLALVVLFTFWPADAVTTLSQITAGQFGVAISLDVSFLGSVIWFALLIAIVRYTQVVIYIERQYAYIHRLEEQLRNYYNNDEITFTREGKSYLQKYPTFSNWICFLYTSIFPISLLVIVSIKIVSEWVDVAQTNLLILLLNTVVAVCILVSLVLYMLFMHKQNTD
ncbi:hypothetical protein N8083_01435 [Candidatus Pacebacteria bacterium]|nr:hypothetical protein [Candidatus Paceibacterota bacterium]